MKVVPDFARTQDCFHAVYVSRTRTNLVPSRRFQTSGTQILPPAAGGPAPAAAGPAPAASRPSGGSVCPSVMTVSVFSTRLAQVFLPPTWLPFWPRPLHISDQSHSSHRQRTGTKFCRLSPGARAAFLHVVECVTASTLRVMDMSAAEQEVSVFYRMVASVLL